MFFAADGDDLFGILTRPTVPSNGVVVLLVWGAGAYPTPGRNQVRTRLARKLAGSGYHVLRMDYRGGGESSGTPPAFEFSRPPTQDVGAACQWLQKQGLSRVALVGSCFGARTVLASSEAIGDLAGVALIGCPVRDEDHAQTAAGQMSLSWYSKRAFTPAALKGLARSRTRAMYWRWATAKIRRMAATSLARIGRHLPGSRLPDESASPRFFRQIAGLVQRRTPMLFIYSAGDAFYRDFRGALRGPLGRLLERAGYQLEVRVISGRFSVYASTAAQEELIGILDAWLSALAPVPTGQSGHPAQRNA